MIKNICIISLAAICALTGNYFSAGLKKRVAALKAADLMLAEIKLMIEYNSADVYEITEALAGHEGLKILWFLSELDLMLKNSHEVPFGVQWEEAVRKWECPFFKGEERKLIVSVGENLGRSGIDGQLRFIEMARQELSGIISRAEEENVRKGKLYRSLGALSGALAAVLLV